MTSSVIELTKQLVSCESITPNDAGCQTIISEILSKAGFTCQTIPFENVSNLWAYHGNDEPTFVLLGHTDVVPPGPLDHWSLNPFKPEIRDGNIFGRGTADMKGALAAMVIAAEKFVKQYPKHRGKIAFLITSDEEGPAQNGTKKVVEFLKRQGQQLDYCLVGEAASEKALGDSIKIGRRGSLSGKLTVIGKQYHIAYPEFNNNAIQLAIPALNELIKTHWDYGNDHFPPTSFQISNIHAGNGANNIIPGTIDILFNFRYSPETTAENLRQTVIDIIQKYHDKYVLEWHHSGEPFITTNSKLVNEARKAIHNVTSKEPQLSTAGGTSDGRFVAPTGCDVVEVGVSNRTIHQIDEHVPVDDLNNLAKIYHHILENMLGT